MGLQITFGDEYWATDKVNMTSNMRFAFSKNALTELDKTLFIIICTVTHSTGNHILVGLDSMSQDLDLMD